MFLKRRVKNYNIYKAVIYDGKAEFSASLLQSSVLCLHDILCWFGAIFYFFIFFLPFKKFAV